MAKYNIDLDELGKNIQDIVDKAVNAQDYQKLNQTISQVVDKAVDVSTDAVHRVTRRASQAKVTYRKMQTPPIVEQRNDLPELYGKTGGKTALAIVKITGGGILSCCSLAVILAGGLFQWIAGAPAGFPMLLGTGFLALSAGLIGNGISALKKLNRFKRYRKLLGNKTYCALEKLARGVGKSVKFVRRELQKMIRTGYFPEGHIDEEKTTLIISDETYRHYQQSKLQLAQRTAQEKLEAQQPRKPSQVQEVLDKGEQFVAQLRRCNDRIPCQVISQKISRMETIVERIFDRVEAKPELVPDVKKLMDYYLPMTVKLLNAYADMDAQPVQGETIQSSKKEIEDTLDTLNLAYENLLDDLFEETAMDVSSDISVLQTLLAQEGLTEDEISRIKKENAL